MYPAETLVAWKKSHEAKFQKGTVESAQQLELLQRSALFTAHSDELINTEVERIRKGRHVVAFPTREAAQGLAARVDGGEFAGGSSAARARALAWCARLLALGETSTSARIFLEKAIALGAGEEAVIAEAFLLTPNDKDGALALLAPLDSPAARSASLRIVFNHDGNEQAMVWLEKTGLKVGDFDSEGKLNLLLWALGLSDWERALTWSAEVTDDDFRNSPVLQHAVAMTELVQAVPREIRTAVLNQIPFEAARFPLASDTAALAARRRAAKRFVGFSDYANSIACTAASLSGADYALWLNLRDSSTHEQAMSELRDSMRDSAHSLRRLNLALKFGIKLDVAAVERQIEQRIALSGKGTADEAVARFSLVFVQENPRAAAEYIARHRTFLYEHLEKGSIEVIEIELLAQGGMVDKANQLLSQAITDGLGEREQESLRRIIAEVDSDDPTAARRQAFEQSNDLADLVNLIRVLEERKNWREAVPYAEALYTRTGAIEDAVRVAIALNTTGDYRKLHAFLEGHLDMVRQSENLGTFWAWSLYREGKFNEARDVLKQLLTTRDDVNDRTLRVNLALASGEWHDLIAHTTLEWERRDQRTPAELMAAGQVAQAVNAPHARDLVTEAAKRAPDDPSILAAAYFHATNAGWEQNPITGQWLSRAAALSGEDGPLRSMSMKELVERKPEWDKRESSAWQKLNAGQIPMFGAAHMLGRSLLDFMLLSSLANMNEPDLRRRAIIYGYSGARPGFSVPKYERIALDLAAIITLARLNLLGTILSTYTDVVIPNSTLGWLFEEQQQARFHQPSRIKDAHLLKRLVAAKALQILPPSATRDHALDREVGSDFADLLITARAKAISDPSTPRYVVRPAPVHRIGSLMEEDADLTTYQDILCNCQAVVTKLSAKGLLTVGEEEVARAHLKLQEHAWPSEVAIADNAELFLDDLSVTYLRTIGVLDKLAAAGLTAFVHESEDNDANRLIALEALAASQLEIIETIRRTLADGIRTGHVHASRSRDAENGEMMRLHPTVAVLTASENVDAFVVDDRFVNRHDTMTENDIRTPIITTLDLLQDLAERGALTPAAHFAHRIALRRAGYQLIPLTEEELLFHLGNAQVVDKVVVETAELRAIRDSLLRAQISKVLQIPIEVPWLHKSMQSVVHAIRTLWRNGTNAESYAQWLLRLLDVRGFAASTLPGNERNFALYAHASQLLQLIQGVNEMDNEAGRRYQAWLDETIFKDVRATQPEVFAWLVDRCRTLVTHTAQSAATELES